jgi:hypothetical protein
MRALIRVTAWERKAIWRRLLCAFGRVGLLVVGLVVLGDVFLPPCSIFFVKRKISRSVPGVNEAVRPLADYSVSEAPGTTVTYSGFEFEVPWKTTFKTKVPKGRRQVFEFASGQIVLFWIAENQDGLLTALAKDPSLHMDGLRGAFPQLMNGPAYDQYWALLNTTPASIHPFGPQDEAARRLTLLMIKAIAISGDLKSGIFSFELPDKRGFQIGDPRAVSRLQLKVFDLNGHNIDIFLSEKDVNARFTQPEVNRIIRSLHTVEECNIEDHAAKEVALESAPSSGRD